MLIAKWIALLLVSWAVNIFAILFSPVFGLCVKKVLYTSYVKRSGREQTFIRYVMWDWLNWFQTFDNACDEYYWGVYGNTADVSVDKYNLSALLRYWYRVCWLARNPAYGFGQTVLGANPPAWQFKELVPVRSPIGVGILTGHLAVFYFIFPIIVVGIIAAYFVYLYAINHTLDVNIGWKPHPPLTRLMYASRLLTFSKK